MKKKKVLYWVLGVAGFLVLCIGAYAFTLYTQVSKTVKEVNQPLDRDVSPKRNQPASLSDGKPISILMMGVDKRENDAGRSDSLMLVTLNPAKQSMITTSIPRDTYTEIVGKGTMDKINHAYAFGGPDMAVNTVENFLNVPVDYYVEVNMEGFKDVVDAVGGIEVTNNFAFKSGAYTFNEGGLHLNGDQALAYTRMRKEDPNGDFGRQARQRQVMLGIVQKGANIGSLANLGAMLQAVGSHVRTNLTQQDMLSVVQHYKDCRLNADQDMIEGQGRMMNQIYYYMVSDAVRQSYSDKLREHLSLGASKVAVKQ
ncbi:polyisoprenyl-teichoic acid--peptidoglycan teichoic acid transferase TagU [Ectobacillus ponti]|uniref:Polyisoprenyl-teichoic acid--peptidoglycan teichoic acid transferase TagU n=1 Tax=Ectobacillus ponti TaxID=2961894 RepID=A0AA41X380_9BACI|nr:LytR family transcriptional regulator [Ectobacillus ponti]MCP8967802.1 LytR family transcriptional regulator [Ectobacillus ponti]